MPAEPVRPARTTSPAPEPERRRARARALDVWTAIFSWIWLLLIGVIVIAVVLRFAFGIGRIELEELQWHLYAVGFLVGIVACVGRDRHVRVDVFRERMSPRGRDWVEFYGLLLLQLPFIAVLAWSSLPLVVESFMAGERSAAASGLAHRWVLKAFLSAICLALGFVSFARLARVARRLFRETEP